MQKEIIKILNDSKGNVDHCDNDGRYNPNFYWITEDIMNEINKKDTSDSFLNGVEFAYKELIKKLDLVINDKEENLLNYKAYSRARKKTIKAKQAVIYNIVDTKLIIFSYLKENYRKKDKQNASK